jgi:carbamoyl-phosphate synthase large subunit
VIKNILITSAGRRVSLVKNFQQTLKEFYPTGQVFTTDLEPMLSSACQISDGFLKVPRVTDKQYLTILKQYCKEKNISIVIPTIDTELHILADAKKEFLKEGVFLAVSSLEICKTFYLKDSTEQFFLKNSFGTPKHINDIASCAYPIFAKLNNSSCSVGAQIVNTSDRAKELCQKDKNYVFQEYIQGDEFTVDAFIDRYGTVVSIVPRQRLEIRAGEVSKAKAVRDQQIIQIVKKLCSTLKGAYGCITIQLFKTLEKKIIFIEINPRFGGGYPLSFHAGADFANYLIRDYLGECLTYNEDWKNNTLMLRYDAEVIVDGSGI